MCYWVLWHREVTGSTGVCTTEKLNERSLLRCEPLRRVKFNSLTCLRKGLSLWAATGGFRWLCRTQRSSSGSLYGASAGNRCSVPGIFPPHPTWMSGHREGSSRVSCDNWITGLSSSRGQRGFVERWLGGSGRGGGEVANRLVMKGLFLPWLLGPRLHCSQNVLPNSGGWWDWTLIMNGLMIRNKH